MRREPGLVEVLFNGGDIEFERFATPVDHLYVIPAGRKVPNPSEIVESRKLRDYIRRLEEAFDFVIIDSPPVLAVADALSLAAWANATLVVCSADETTWPMLERSLQELKHVRASVAGVVLNRFDPKSAYGGHGYRYGYAYGYSYGGDGAETQPSAPARG